MREHCADEPLLLRLHYTVPHSAISCGFVLSILPVKALSAILSGWRYESISHASLGFSFPIEFDWPS